MKPKYFYLSLLVAILPLAKGQDADPEPAPSKAVPVEDDAESATPEEAEIGDEKDQGGIIIPLPTDSDGSIPKLKQLPPELANRLINEGEIEKPVEPAKIIERSEEAVEAPEDFIQSENKLHLPFQPKPINPAPIGWTFKRMPADSKPWIKKVPLADGSTVDLEVRPFKLAVPSLGKSSFAIREPGFKPEQGYRQQRTVGAILTSYDLELDTSERAFDELIRELDEVLASLPSETPNP